MKVLIYLALVLQPSWQIEDKLTLRLTCDNEATVFLDGEKMEGLTNLNNWTLVTTVEIPLSFSVIGIQCFNTYGPGGLIASIENSSGETIMESDNTWTCSLSYEEDWQKKDFDQDWSTSLETIDHGTNPWGTLPGISQDAKWLSTGSSESIYCRIKAPPCSGLPVEWTALKTDAQFPVIPGTESTISCVQENYRLVGSREITCSTGTSFTFQEMPLCYSNY